MFCLPLDSAALRTLLALEFVLTARRARQAKAEGAAGGTGVGVVVSFGANVLLGGFCAFVLARAGDPMWGMAFAQAVMMWFVTMMLVGEHLPGLVDTAKIEVIAATPVADRTVLAARLVHILFRLSLTVLALALLPMVVGAITFGVWFVPLYLAVSALGAATCVAVACGLFVLAARLFDPERFRDLLLYGQIAAMVVFMGGIQALTGLADMDQLAAWVGGRSWWLTLLPPFHAGGLLALATGERSALVVALCCLAVLTPLASLALVMRLAAHGFVARLAAMATAAHGAPDVRARRRPLRDLLLASLTARAGYDFFLALSRRERLFRMHTYPMIALAIVMGAFFAIRSDGLASPMLCGAVYFLGLYAPGFVAQARFSENSEARWLFRAAPLAAPGELLVGCLMALLTTFVLPVAVLMSLLVVAIGGLPVVWDTLFALEATVIITILAMLVLGRSIPFTEPLKGAPTGSIPLMLAMMSVIGGFIGLHVLVRTSPFAFGCALVVLPIAAWLLLDGLRYVTPRVPWLSGG